MSGHPSELPIPSELDRRRVTLGGSTIAAACGVDPYCSPIRLWCELTGRLEREPSEAMEWGKRLEPVVKAALEENGYAIGAIAEVRDTDRPWLVGVTRPLTSHCLACNREPGWPMCDLCERMTDAEVSAAGKSGRGKAEAPKPLSDPRTHAHAQRGGEVRSRPHPQRERRDAD